MTTYVRELITGVGRALLILLVTALLFLGFVTVRSLYPGELDRNAGSRRAGSASVKECQRLGPVSTYGFGYWWRCRIVVSLSDGGTASVTVGHSIVTPADRSRRVTVVEDCSAPDHTNCSYARPGGYLPGLSLRLLALVSWLLAAVGVLMAGTFLLRALLGARLSARLFRKRARDGVGGGVDTGGSTDGQEYAAASGDSGVLVLALGYPATRASNVYQATTPRVTIDGEDVPDSGWGKHRLVLPPGRHRLEVTIPSGAFRGFGAASRTFVVASGSETGLRYDAPSVLGRVGSIRGLNDLPADEVSVPRVLVAVIILVGIIYFLVRLALR